MNKGLLAILAAAALAATKNASSGAGSFGKKRNKSLEKFDRDIQGILANLGAKKAGVSLFDAYKKAQKDMDYAESCSDCPQAYAYAALMLSILTNIDGYSVPYDYLVAEDGGAILSGEDIQEVFAFEATPKGKKFSDSLMWKIEGWFIKVQSDLQMIIQAKPNMANDIKDSSVQSLIDETMNAYAMLSDQKLKPNYAGPGILSMGITGYFLVQYIKLFVALPGDKNITPVLKSIIGELAAKGRIDERYYSIFSHIQNEKEGELPILFKNNFFLDLWMTKIDEMIVEKNKIIATKSSEDSRLYQKTKRDLMMIERSKEQMIKKFGRYTPPITERDRFISEFFAKNKRTSQGIIVSSAAKMLKSLYLLSKGQNIDFSELKAYAYEAYKKLFEIESKVSDQLYVITRIDPNVRSDDRDIRLVDRLLSIFEIRNQYKEDVINIELVSPVYQYSNEQTSISNRYTDPSKMSIINNVLGVPRFNTGFVSSRSNSFYDNHTDELAVETTLPNPSEKFAKIFDYENNRSIESFMDTLNEARFIRDMNISRQQFDSDEDIIEAYEEWESNNWCARGVDLEPLDYENATLTEEELSENVLSYMFGSYMFRWKATKIDSLDLYLLLLSKFQIDVKEKMGGGLEDGMIRYFSERVGLTNDLFERSMLRIDQLKQAAEQQNARILAAAQQRRLLNVALNEEARLFNMARLEELREKEALERAIDYSSKPLSITGSQYFVLAELDNSVALDNYENIDQSILNDEHRKTYNKIRPLKTLLIEYIDPFTLRSISNITPGNLCVGNQSQSYMDGLKRGSQKHYGIVVETSEGLHVVYHTHTERGRITKDKFTNKWNTNGFPFANNEANKLKVNSADAALRYEEILNQSLSLIVKH